eukprot:GHRR01033730.1.p1 GENE.GHRR01033730.1~~GHRR01033730.1.p1  ORF type:complete len:115 (+),score=24.55 GHRR01033730.1:297-641(+)
MVQVGSNTILQQTNCPHGSTTAVLQHPVNRLASTAIHKQGSMAVGSSGIQSPPTVCDSQSTLELWLNAQLCQPAVYLGATSMHQHGSDADSPKQDKVSNHTSLHAVHVRIQAAP